MPLFLSQPGSESKHTPPLRGRSHCEGKLPQLGISAVNDWTTLAEFEYGLHLSFLTVRQDQVEEIFSNKESRGTVMHRSGKYSTLYMDQMYGYIQCAALYLNRKCSFNVFFSYLG